MGGPSRLANPSKEDKPSTSARSTSQKPNSYPRWQVVVITIAIPIFLAYYVFRTPKTTTKTTRKIPISQALARNLEVANTTWEHGILTHALLELQNPELTVFAGPGYGVHLQNPNRGYVLTPFPDDKLPLCKANGRYGEWTQVKGLRYAARKVMTKQQRGERFGVTSEKCLDEAGLGWALLLLGRAKAEDPANPKIDGSAYDESADMLMDRLIADGIVRGVDSKSSMGSGQYCEDGRVQSRFGFLVPTFLASYGAARNEGWYVNETVEELVMFAEMLDRSSGEYTGVWKQCVSNDGVDDDRNQAWIESSVWTLAGVTRVLAVVKNWKATEPQRAGQAAKAQQVAEILLQQLHDMWPEMGGVYDVEVDHEGTKREAPQLATAALTAGAIYRLAQLGGTEALSHVGWADELYTHVAENVREDGRLLHTTESEEQTTSEGQTSVLLMFSARRDCLQLGICSLT